MSTEEKSERLVELDSTVGTALILAYPTGIMYTNQVAGTACFHPKAEGVLIPFENDYGLDGKFFSLEIELARYFRDTWGTSGAPDGITTADADAIDALLRSRGFIDWFHVDRERQDSSYEAWIHVTVLSDHAFYCLGFGPYPRRGILTWANSD